MHTIDDFCYARRGQITNILFANKADVLQAVRLENTRKKQRALLLLHGFSSTPAVFRKLLPLLTAYDAVICPVLPGHAHSLAEFSKVKAKDWIQYVESLLASLLQIYNQVDVMGLSLGGLLACHLSQQFKCHHAYLLAPALALKQHTTFNYYLAKCLLALGFEHIRNAAGDICNNDESELTYRRLPIATIAELLKLIREFKVTNPLCETDIFLGHFDHVVDSKQVAQYFEGITNCHIHWLKKSAHILPLEQDMERIVSCVNRVNLR